MKSLIHFIYSLLFLSFLFSCIDKDDTLGSALVTSSFRNVITDTCTIDISTLYIDSIETIGDSVCQIGFHQDSVYGKITSSYITEFSVNSFTPEEDHSYVFDSITITLFPSGDYWGDTLALQNLHIHCIESEIILPDNNTLYNTSIVNLMPTPLCTYQLSPRPLTSKSIEIRLPDNWGKTIFDDIMAEKQSFDSQEKFKAYFPGLALVPDEKGSCIMGLKINESSMFLTLYYQDIDTHKEEKELKFSTNIDYAFTKVEHDRSNTPLEALKSGNINAISSTTLNDKAYLMGLTGIYNQIEFPHLNNLRGKGDIVSIEGATIYLYPEANSSTTHQLPTELRLYVADDNNVLEDQIYESSGTTVQSGNLSIDSIYNRDTYYAFDITSFLRDNFTTEGMYRKKLLLNMPDEDFRSTFKKVIFSNKKDEEREMKLQLRYKVYTNQE